MPLPNYKDGSIVNLMSTISKSLGYEPAYKPLKLLNPKALVGSRNVILMVIDGLGYDYVMRNGNVLRTYVKGRISSVFPSTTASCITTFATGGAPQQHGITGWFMLLKELGTISAILRFTPRSVKESFAKSKVSPEQILTEKALFGRLPISCYRVVPKEISKSDYTRATNGKAKIVPCTSLKEYFKKVRKIVVSNKKKKLIYAYCQDLISYAINMGLKARRVLAISGRLRGMPHLS